MLRAPSPSKESVFGSRVEHRIIELVAITPVKDLELAGAQWARAFIKDLREGDDLENALEASYVSLLGNDDSDYKKIYGSFYDKLITLKNKYDPNNVFKYAIPRLLT
ncbi:hypothetical protein F5X96DRAFT_665317 [Biscogniauxia mediterranea]|nr:hypothetical protein F5X96DRAFT_665317 [Biscogniauxia mediterranea]